MLFYGVGGCVAHFYAICHAVVLLTNLKGKYFIVDMAFTGFKQEFTSTSHKILAYIPKWITQKSLIVGLLALLMIVVIFSSCTMEWFFYPINILELILFFYFGHYLSKMWRVGVLSNKMFKRKLLGISFLIRLLFVVFMLCFAQVTTGTFFKSSGDVLFYHNIAQFGADLMSSGDFHLVRGIQNYSGCELADTGYGVYLSIVYYLSGNGEFSIVVARLLKVVWSSLTVIIIYRLAQRNFSESVARMAAIMMMLMPNFWYYASEHLKETEMLLLTVLYVERADYLLRQNKFTFKDISVVLLIGLVLFTFRTVLAVVLFLGLFLTITISNSRIMKWGKRIVVAVLSVMFVLLIFKGQIQSEIQNITSTQNGAQAANMQWRSEREGGNKFAKYAGATVFAPLIFTIPFPTWVDPGGIQQELRFVAGGNYIKNIMSFFCILAMFSLLFSGKWREHLLPVSVMLGYLVILVMSSYAQSERFHIPALPFELMFAAYGISLANKTKFKKWFSGWTFCMFFIVIFWQWFKLKGHGVI